MHMSDSLSYFPDKNIHLEVIFLHFRDYADATTCYITAETSACGDDVGDWLRKYLDDTHLSTLCELFWELISAKCFLIAE